MPKEAVRPPLKTAVIIFGYVGLQLEVRMPCRRFVAVSQNTDLLSPAHHVLDRNAQHVGNVLLQIIG